MATGKSMGVTQRSFATFVLLIIGVLVVLFIAAWLPGHTLASNDGPLGAIMAKCHRLPGWFTGGWEDLNTVGYRGGASFVSISFALQGLLGPVLYSKFYAPFAIGLLGVGAWCFFRQMRFAAPVCIIGGLAAMLNSGYFSVACWGIAAHTNTIAMTFFALACLADPVSPHRWVRVILAGFAVGMGVAEGADVGAIFSVYVAIFALYQAWITDGDRIKNIGTGILRVAVVALCAGFLAAQPVTTLISTAITGVAGTKQDKDTKEQRWDFSTQWSLPKTEVLTLLVPGLFGYRMDTPKHMAMFEDAYKGGQYWGAVGRQPSLVRALDEWERNGRQGNPPGGGLWRFTGGGNYPGLLVILVALWAVAQSFRKEKSVFDLYHRRWIWFWLGVVVVSLLLSFGYYAPFYQVFYALPYASTIRNPAKFLHAVNLGLVALFGLGLNGLWKHYVATGTQPLASLMAHWKNWWMAVSGFDRRWVFGCGAAIAVGFISWLIYGSSRQGVESYVQVVGFDSETAKQIVTFSLHEVGWAMLFLLLAAGLVALVVSRWFAGTRARLASVLIGGLLVLDLGRANLPWIISWNYEQKYQSNAIIDFLRDKPYLHRVAGFPQLFVLPQVAQAFHVPQQWAAVEQYFMGIYGSEWTQQLFMFYNIQTLDIVQLPRMPEDLEAFERTLTPMTLQDFSILLPRHWELTNTRYLLGAAPYVQFLNQALDAKQQRFHVVKEFNFEPKPGIAEPTSVEELTANVTTNGNFALIEFTGALPRASLYSDWQVVTNGEVALKQLADLNFDPHKRVLVTEPIAAPSASTSALPGDVTYESYDPDHIVLKADAKTPCVLLLNDRYDPNWHVTVDGKPATLLHCNYLMRGVQISPGQHTVDFRFAPSIKMFYVSLAAAVIGFALIVFLLVAPRGNNDTTQSAIT
jgi:hypothetical protein